MLLLLTLSDKVFVNTSKIQHQVILNFFKYLKL